MKQIIALLFVGLNIAHLALCQSEEGVGGLVKEYVFEFGHQEGALLRTIEGMDFIWHKEIDVAPPHPYVTTYVKVTVNAVNKPKVNYDGNAETISIDYKLIQIPMSHYKIEVTGMHDLGNRRIH